MTRLIELAFSEGKIKRDRKGRFAPKGGGKGSGPADTLKKHASMLGGKLDGLRWHTMSDGTMFSEIHGDARGEVHRVMVSSGFKHIGKDRYHYRHQDGTQAAIGYSGRRGNDTRISLYPAGKKAP